MTILKYYPFLSQFEFRNVPTQAVYNIPPNYLLFITDGDILIVII
jgi:hypothetical protein